MMAYLQKKMKVTKITNLQNKYRNGKFANG